jgi:type I restriction enzyme S subunit
MVNQYLVCSKGVGSIQRNLYWPHLKRVTTLVPPIDEQVAIARYLHAVDLKITRFIRNRLRLVEVLNEQKQAIINQIVTRGLDPDVSLKPSGVDWLGDIPKHWEVKSLRQLGCFSKGSGGPREDDVAEGVPCIRYGHLYMYFNFTVSAVRTYLSERRACDYARIKYGDILFTASGEDMNEIGKSVVNLIEEEVCCGGDVIILRPRIVVHAPFLRYASDAWHARCQKVRLGRGTTVKHIYGDQLKKVCIAVPPMDEQVAIADHIRLATSEATSLIDHAQREINLIHEYRTRLISDVVTGKIDVRHLAPPPGSLDLEEAAKALEPLEDVIADVEMDNEEDVNESD